MKTRSAIFILCLSLTLYVLSCKKENDPETTPEPVASSYSGIHDFFSSNGVQFQNFTVNGTTGGTFTASKGTKFTIPSNAFVDLNNQPVTGDVTIKVKEIYENKEMLLSKITTTSNDYPLLSGGMFDFEPTVNSVKVKMAPGKSFTAELPADSIDFNMMAFLGEEDSANNVNWQPADSAGGSLSFNTTPPQSYIFDDDSTGWGNVDRFYQTPADISITVNTINNPNPDSTYACVWFTGFRAVWPLDQNFSNPEMFESSHVKPVPVSIIAITIHDGKIYASILTVSSLTANSTYNLDMELMTDDAFKNAVDALD